MSAKTLATLALAAILTVPAILVVASPKASAEDVPQAPGIAWQPMLGFTQTYWLHYNNQPGGSAPDCQGEGRLLRDQPSDGGVTGRATCPYSTGLATGIAGGSGATTGAFVGPTLTHGFNLTPGNVHVIVHGTIPTGIVLSASLSAGGSPLTGSKTATGQRASDATTDTVDISLAPSSGEPRLQFNPNNVLRLTVTSSAGSSVVPSWSFDDTTSRLVLTTDDAYRAATWTGDENTTVKDTFRPFANNTTSYTKLKGFFALQSPFGKDDIADATPTFRVFQNNTLAQPFPGATNTVQGVLLTALSVPDQGLLVWGFPDASLDYRGWAPNEYELRTVSPHVGQTFSSGIAHPFAITVQGVRLTPYAGENVAHTVEGGATTTYVLLANNSGSAADTFEVNAQFIAVPGSPAAGWGATVGGPQVVVGRVDLQPNESKIVTVTVTTPFAASGSGTFLVTARSVRDPTAASPAVTLVTSLGASANREVGLVLVKTEQYVDPGTDTTIPVYAWNRGTRTANLSLDILTPNTGGWTNTLLSGGQPVQHLVLPNVAPGAIAEARLRVHGPDTSATPQFDLTLNTTNLDATGNAVDKVLRFKINVVGGYKVEVLNQILGEPRYVELTGSDLVNVPTNPAVPDRNDDGVDQMLARVWVSNTGRVKEDVTVGITSVSFAQSNSCTDSAFVHTPGSAGFRLVTRSPSGVLTPFGGVLTDLAPGNTSELYVQLAVTRTANPCSDSVTHDDFMSFVVATRGAKTGALGGADVRVVAEDNGGRNAVLVEPVMRVSGTPTGSAPLVDLSSKGKPTLVSSVQVGNFTTYYLRITNGASYSDYVDHSASDRAVKAAVSVRAIGVNTAGGWNVSMRPVLDNPDATLNPYNSSLVLSNVNAADSNRREAWADREIEVRVYAPDGVNHTALANDLNEITLQAAIGDKTSEITLRSVIADVSVVNLTALGGTSILAHPGEVGAGQLTIYNNGSAPTTVTLTAVMDHDQTSNADAWRVDPPALTFDLGAFRNRTVALAVTPPVGASNGVVRVGVQYVGDHQSGRTTTKSLDYAVTVIPGQAPLLLDASARLATTGPGQPAQFALSLQNRGSFPVTYKLTASEIPNWTITVPSGLSTIQPGQTLGNIPVVVQAPSDVFSGTSYQTILRAQDQDSGDDFSVLPVTINILGGAPVPSIASATFQKTVDRGATQVWELSLRNLGNAAGALPVSVRTDEAGWSAAVSDATGKAVTSVNVGPNEIVKLNLTVTAPLAVPENKAVAFEVTASTPDLTQVSRATVRALIHDYGVKAELPVSSVDIIPGLVQEHVLRVTNTGNDNDTLNVSAILPETDFKDWTMTISPDHVFLNPGQSVDVHATLRAPTSPLPSPRAYGFQYYVGTVGGAAVNVAKNVTIPASVSVLNYRALDVDGDGQSELAIDADKSLANGYEQFREISGEGSQCVVVSSSRLANTARFFLDCPTDVKPVDGVADVWFDPDAGYAYKITLTPDVNGDGTPDYLLDTDRDGQGKIDMAYDTVAERYWDVTEVHALSSDTTQYLVDTNRDGSPDYYVDVQGKVATKTQSVAGKPASIVGLDTQNDGKVDKYYDVSTKEVSGATAANVRSFFADYWYFLVGFALVVIVAVALIVVRARKPKQE